MFYHLVYFYVYFRFRILSLWLHWKIQSHSIFAWSFSKLYSGLWSYHGFSLPNPIRQACPEFCDIAYILSKQVSSNSIMPYIFTRHFHQFVQGFWNYHFLNVNLYLTYIIIRTCFWAVQIKSFTFCSNSYFFIHRFIFILPVLSTTSKWSCSHLLSFIYVFPVLFVFKRLYNDSSLQFFILCKPELINYKCSSSPVCLQPMLNCCHTIIPLWYNLSMSRFRGLSNM